MAEVFANRIAATFPEDFVRNYRFPDDYRLTSEMRQFAVEHGLNADEEFQSFLAECIAADSKHADWGAAWRYHVYRLKDAYEIDANAPHSRVLCICGLMKQIDDLVGEITTSEEERHELRAATPSYPRRTNTDPQGDRFGIRASALGGDEETLARVCRPGPFFKRGGSGLLGVRRPSARERAGDANCRAECKGHRRNLRGVPLPLRIKHRPSRGRAWRGKSRVRRSRSGDARFVTLWGLAFDTPFVVRRQQNNSKSDIGVILELFYDCSALVRLLVKDGYWKRQPGF